MKPEGWDKVKNKLAHILAGPPPVRPKFKDVQTTTSEDEVAELPAKKRETQSAGMWCHTRSTMIMNVLIVCTAGLVRDLKVFTRASGNHGPPVTQKAELKGKAAAFKTTAPISSKVRT